MSVATVFDESYYLSNNADVVLAISQGHFTSALQHYQLFGGKSELRDPNSTFDASYYASKNPDVLTAVSNGLIANVFTHYQIFGEKENRAPSVTYEGFTASAYLAANADVQAAVTAGTIASALEHYIAFGQNETRSGSGITVSTGTTFTLTTAADSFTGTTGNDTFTAVDTTLGIADQVDGGAGTDRLNYTDSSNGGDIPFTALSNIETYYIRNVETANAGETYNFANVAGETQVWSDRSTDSSTFNNLGKGTTVGLNGDGSTVLGAVNFQMATASDDVAIAINGGVGASGTAPAITEVGSNGTATSATISSTGAANTVGTVDLAAATLTSVTVTATTNLKGDFFSQATDQIGTDGKITISGAATSVELTAALDNTIKTIDASGLTAGGVTATLGTLATQSFTGGSGSDVITTAAAPTSGSIDGGAGTDTLILGASAHLDSSAEAALFKNWETLRTATTFDMNLLSSLTGLQVTATAGATTFSNLDTTEAANIQILGAINAAGISFSLADGTGSGDALSLKLGNDLTTTGTAVDADSITFNSIETLNLTAVHGSSATVGAQRTATVADFTSDKATAINLKGSAFSLENVATTKAVTIDATALTGDGGTTNKGLTATGSLVAASTINGSALVDTLTIGAVGSTYNGNAGNDTFIATQTIAAGTTAISGGDGTDTLQLTDTAATTATLTISDNSFKALSGVEQLTFSGAVAGDFIWTLGGYANAIATANSGTLKVTAADFASGVTGDVITIDASGLSASNGIDLTLTNTVGVGAANVGTDTYTGGSGADTFTINYDADNANDQSVVTISAGGGNDTIKFTMGTGTSAPGTITLDGGAGDDTITGSVEIDTITGGAGTDTMTGNAGNDIFVITTASHSNAASAGAIDKITDFAGGGGDDLKVGANATELNAQTLTVGYTSADTIDELNALLNSTNGTSSAKFDGTGADAAQLTTSDARILVAVDVDASGTFTAADVVVELTGLTGTLANTDIIV